MNTSTFHFPVIAPLVARHAEDAAFYWSQIDRARNSPQFGFQKLKHFNHLLDAHLEGLMVAGLNGWPVAMRALERWRKADEAFVCTILAVRKADHVQLKDVLAIAGKHPDELLRGIISALAWTGVQAREIIHAWSHPDGDPLAQVAALRAVSVLGADAVTQLACPLAIYFESSSCYIRASACRAAATADQVEVMSLLRAALDDPELAVRAEAAIALATLEQLEPALAVLRACVLSQASLQGTTTGWFRMQSVRRLHRWTEKLALLTAPGAPDVHDLLPLLPARSALTFVMAHGDLVHLPFVVEQMANPEVDRYAGWVWQVMTDTDLQRLGWTVPEPPMGGVTEPKPDVDNGLARPDYAAVRTYAASSPYSELDGERVLYGKVLDIPHACTLLETAPQAVRFLAAHTIRRMMPAIRMNVRAPARAQRSAMGALSQVRGSEVVG